MNDSDLPEASRLKALSARVLEMCSDAGASQADASISYSRGFSISVREGDIESLEFQRDRSLGLTIYLGKRQGNASTGDLSDAGLRQCVDAAAAIARVTEEDPFSGLADPERMAVEVRDLDLDHPWAIDPAEAIERARACESSALAVDKRIEQSEGASISTQRGTSVYANSHGFVGTRTGTHHGASCAVVASDDAGMQRDYWWDGGRNVTRMQSAEEIGKIAGERTIARLGSRSLSTRKAPVLFVPEVARSLFGHFVSAVSGGALYRKSTFLLEHLGQRVFSDIVSLRQSPFIPQGSSSACYDQEGVATAERELVGNGVLQGWLLGSYSARKLGLESTGNAGGVFNLEISAGAKSREALMAEMGTGFLVTELLGQGVNGVTGDYSRGAAGFWVENGEVVMPVEGVTIAGNLLDMYRNIVALGSDVDTRSSIRSGSVLVSEMTLAGDQ